MGNFIISEDHYDTLLGYHQSDKDIKLYFGDEFELNNKFLQKVKNLIVLNVIRKKIQCLIYFSRNVVKWNWGIFFCGYIQGGGKY